MDEPTNCEAELAERAKLLEELHAIWVAAIRSNDYKKIAEIIVRLGGCDHKLAEMWVEDLIKQTRRNCQE